MVPPTGVKKSKSNVHGSPRPNVREHEMLTLPRQTGTGDTFDDLLKRLAYGEYFWKADPRDDPSKSQGRSEVSDHAFPE